MADEQTKSGVSIGYLVRNFLWDFILMMVLVINLLLICFDWFFSIPGVYGYFMENTPGFFEFFNPIHLNLKVYDLLFVGVYVVDVLIGWGVSIFKRKEKFYDYPFSHWYDVLGCIPAGSLVFLRLLRLVSIVMRLYKKNLLNLNKIAFFRKCVKVYNIILEEVSDRVVLNILGGIQNNIKLGMPITREVIDNIVIPYKRQVIDIVFSRISSIAGQEYDKHKAELASYISSKSRSAVEGNKELQKLGCIPVVGQQIKETIERSVSDTVVQVVDGLVRDVISDDGQSKLRDITNEVTDFAIEGLERDLSKIVTDVVLEVVNLIARTANVKQWKLAEVREQINAARQAENPDPELISKLEADYQTLFMKEMQKSWE
ncbi:MAG: hypothetical protein MJZ66_02945 [Bacteroidales bacterium]|nr:hypothetical protein [Bacteroidales bacterium]